jgi:hypothetical protein
MKRLKHALEASLPELTSLGGEGRNVDRDRLEALLRNLAVALDRAYWLRSNIVFWCCLCWSRSSGDMAISRCWLAGPGPE